MFLPGATREGMERRGYVFVINAPTRPILSIAGPEYPSDPFRIMDQPSLPEDLADRYAMAQGWEHWEVAIGPACDAFDKTVEGMVAVYARKVLPDPGVIAFENDPLRTLSFVGC